MNIVLIAPFFYSFENHIAISLRQLGHSVFLFNEKPNVKSSLLRRIAFKLPNAIFLKLFDRHVQTIINSVSKIATVDIIIFIRGEYWKDYHLHLLKKTLPKTQFVMYQWDFSKNLPNLVEQLIYFNKVFTFDRHDALHYSMTLKPLFYTSLHYKERSRKEHYKIKYKVSFIGTHHSDRFEFIKNFISANNLQQADCFFYLLRSKSSYFYNKYIIGKNIGNISYNDCMNSPLDEADVIDVLMSSECILDIHQLHQTGLTSRTIEALGLQKKLITTNSHVRDYDFYNPNNTLIIDRSTPIVPMEFWLNCYQPTPTEIYMKYHIQEWVKDFLL